MTTSGKTAKTPPIGPKTTLLSFDLESNGLHGQVFAVGAVVVGASGKPIDEFCGRCPIPAAVDEWVEANVLPAIGDMKITHKDSDDLGEAFWRWYLRAEPKADYVLVSNGYPVEYRFLLQLQEKSLKERYWQHPFPILDLTSLLLAAGQDAPQKSRLITEIVKAGNFRRHHPLDDALIAAQAAFQALNLAE